MNSLEQLQVKLEASSIELQAKLTELLTKPPAKPPAPVLATPEEIEAVMLGLGFPPTVKAESKPTPPTPDEAIMNEVLSRIM